MKKDFVTDGVLFQNQLKYMRHIEEKAPLEALSGLETYCLSINYLPYKLYKLIGWIMEGKYESTEDFNYSGPENLLFFF